MVRREGLGKAVKIQGNLGLTNPKGPKILLFKAGAFFIAGAFDYKPNYRGT
jgi:hypothetical protein